VFVSGGEIDVVFGVLDCGNSLLLCFTDVERGVQGGSPNSQRQHNSDGQHHRGVDKRQLVFAGSVEDGAHHGLPEDRAYHKPHHDVPYCGGRAHPASQIQHTELPVGRSPVLDVPPAKG